GLALEEGTDQHRRVAVVLDQALERHRGAHSRGAGARGAAAAGGARRGMQDSGVSARPPGAGTGARATASPPATGARKSHGQSPLRRSRLAATRKQQGVRIMPGMQGQVAIVTGSNSGIGLETARSLATRGATVILACRDLGKAQAARDDIARSSGRDDLQVLALDLGSKASIRAFAHQFRASHGRLDVLVNNAGVWSPSRRTTSDGFELTFGVNHLGTFLLTHELLPVLGASAPSRVVVVSSALHSRGRMHWDDLQFERARYSGSAAYSQSKLANVLFTLGLARRLEGRGVTVNAVHPGVVATELTRDYPRLLVRLLQLFQLTPEQGAACSLYVATSPEVAALTGQYFEKSKPRMPARRARDRDAQERLWAASERLLGLSGGEAARPSASATIS
ncbi:MAG TPA: SDR family oxidoreductase, partial [Planctomycetota bacterium]|nr:SDR family oxidoreductase [Planctomycetota bacterium]